MRAHARLFASFLVLALLFGLLAAYFYRAPHSVRATDFRQAFALFVLFTFVTFGLSFVRVGPPSAAAAAQARSRPAFEAPRIPKVEVRWGPQVRSESAPPRRV